MLQSEGRRLANVIGFDDAPFSRAWRGSVPLIGAVFASVRFDGLLCGSVSRDGDDATQEIIRLIRSSRFVRHLQAVLLQGIAVAGFNVVDVSQLSAQLGLPVLVVARRRPNLQSMHKALVSHVPGGQKKWELIVQAGPMEPVADVFAQRAGLSTTEAASLIGRLALHGHIPEPLRVAHLIAGGLARGQSRGRV